MSVRDLLLDTNLQMQQDYRSAMCPQCPKAGSQNGTANEPSQACFPVRRRNRNFDGIVPAPPSFLSALLVTESTLKHESPQCHCGLRAFQTLTQIPNPVSSGCSFVSRSYMVLELFVPLPTSAPLNPSSTQTFAYYQTSMQMSIQKVLYLQSWC
jgi:hypothetical protein